MDAGAFGGIVTAAGEWIGISTCPRQSLTAGKLMNAHDYLSDDGQALLALCSAFALPENAAAEGLEPFKLSEWNQLARQIHGSSLKRPAALPGRAAGDLAR